MKTEWHYNDFRDTYGFDLWGEWGERNEVYYDDPDLVRYLEEDRIVSLVDYGCSCEFEDGLGQHDEPNCEMLNDQSDFVFAYWARVDVIRRVLLPENWRTFK